MDSYSLMIGIVESKNTIRSIWTVFTVIWMWVRLLRIHEKIRAIMDVIDSRQMTICYVVGLPSTNLMTAIVE